MGTALKGNAGFAISAGSGGLRKHLTALAGVVLLGGTTAALAAESYPAKPIKIVVSETPGSGSDIIARQIGAMLTEAWGQSVIVENKPGASGIIGAEAVAKAPADGYTLWVASLSQLVGTVMLNRYVMSEEFAPVTLIASTTNIMAVNEALPVKTIPELIAYAKARPGMLYGSAGVATGMHLCMELFRTVAGLNMVHVPYKGAGPLLTDLSGGHVPVACVPTAAVQASVASGRVRALAVTSLHRTDLAPGMVPVADSVPGFEVLGWYGLLATLHTPADIVNQLNAVVGKALRTPALQEKLKSMGTEAAGGPPAQFGAMLKSDAAKWGKVLKDSNIRPE